MTWSTFLVKVVIVILAVGWIVEYLRRKDTKKLAMWYAGLFFRAVNELLEKEGHAIRVKIEPNGRITLTREETYRGASNNKEGKAPNLSDSNGSGTCLPDSAPRVRGSKTKQRGQATTDRKDSKR